MKEYEYPLDLDWTTQEMVVVTDLWAAVEKAYETTIEAEHFLVIYHKFKQVVPSIGEEKRLGKKFQQLSGYSLYQVVQQAKKQKVGKIKLGG